MKLEETIIKFITFSLEQYAATQEGDHKTYNSLNKKIDKAYLWLKTNDFLDVLLDAVKSSAPEVRLRASAYCLKYNPQTCLGELKRLKEKEKESIIGLEAEHVMKHWADGTWGIG